MAMGLLSARRRFMGRRHKPYDAEIEYLEVNEDSGPCYIDTEYVPNGPDIGVDAVMEVLGYNNNTIRYPAWYIAGTADTSFYRITRYQTFDTSIIVNNGDTTNQRYYIDTNSWQENHKYSIAIKGVDFYMTNGTAKATRILNPYNGIENTNSTLKIFSPELDNFTYMKLYSFKLSKGDETVLDLIPVRKGGKGYMYDKVSGRLFGSMTDNDFIIGPDI